MSFFKKKRSQEAKQRYENQVHLAKHSPDTLFDLSGCELAKVPSEVYCLCRVLLKETLMLNNNKLRNLMSDGSYTDFGKLKETLRVLDAHENQISELPDTIGLLQRIQVLNMENNHLTRLPTQIGSLRALQTLNLKGNRLTHLPDEIGDLMSMRSLDIGDNPLKRLPPTMSKLKCLETLVLDSENMEFPPSDVCSKGSAAVMKFLCNQAGVKYKPPSSQVLPLLNVPNTRRYSVPAPGCSSDSHLDALADATRAYDRMRAARQKEQANIQQKILEAQAETAALVADCNRNKRKLLGQIEKEQIEIDDKGSFVKYFTVRSGGR